MAPNSIGNTPGASVAEIIQQLKSDLANDLMAGQRTSSRTAATDGSKDIGTLGQALQYPPPVPLTIADVASVLLAEVAVTDLGKLSSILNLASDPKNSKVLDSLLNLAVQELAKGNDGRAVGYLADYATRDPLRAEALPLQPELEPVRDKIDAMVSRMAQVAKMSAEDGLSRAEQTVNQLTGKIPTWDTSAEVLIKLAHRLFDAGGYANYSRTAELAKVVASAGEKARPNDQALSAVAASAASASTANQAVGQMVPGINVPYWVSPDFPVGRTESAPRLSAQRKVSTTTLQDISSNLKDVKAISVAAVRQLWLRAPLMVMMLGYFAVGLAGGIAFAIGSSMWPDTMFVSIGNIAFGLWAVGFLALVGFGFYARVKNIQPTRH